MRGLVLLLSQQWGYMKPQDIDTPEQRRAEKQGFAKMIGRHLRKMRLKNGISQENLSLKAGYYRTYVGKIEQGLYSPSLHTVWRLATALGYSLQDFFVDFGKRRIIKIKRKKI